MMELATLFLAAFVHNLKGTAPFSFVDNCLVCCLRANLSLAFPFVCGLPVVRRKGQSALESGDSLLEDGFAVIIPGKQSKS